MRRRVLAAAACLTWLIAGCGGGGGGGGSAAASPSGTSTVESATSLSGSLVTVGTPEPASLKAEILRGATLPLQVFTGPLSGQPERLANVPIFVLIEDPAGLTVTNGTGVGVYQDGAGSGSGYRYMLNLAGATAKTAGRLTGNLRVFACLDPGCLQPLGGTPLVIPYDVTVAQGMAIDKSLVDVTVPFGQVPAPVTINVTSGSLPTTWQVDASALGDAVRVDSQAPTATAPRSGSGSFDLLFPLLPVGTYVRSVGVYAAETFASGKTATEAKQIDVRYTVTATPGMPVFVDPAIVDVAIASGQPSSGKGAYTIIAADGGNTNYPTPYGSGATLLGVDYLTTPDGSPVPFSWWMPEFKVALRCGGSPTACLAPGVYTAQVRHRVTGSSGTYDFAVPLRLTVAN